MKLLYILIIIPFVCQGQISPTKLESTTSRSLITPSPSKTMLIFVNFCNILALFLFYI